MFKKSFRSYGGRKPAQTGRSFNSRPGRGRSGGNRGGGGRGKRPQFMDVSKFINKAVITEEVVHFEPEHRFKDFQIDDKLKANILARGYDKPTPIQDRAINHVLQGLDVVGIANTGTGKTAAFLIPLINKALQNSQEKILIMVPTRELAIQINDELKAFTKGLKIFSVCCSGGAAIGPQISQLRHHNNFIIGTPGRLKDLMRRNFLRLSGFNTVVLDEADRMLDMGFIADMRFMMAAMPRERHTLFFSATITHDIERLINEFLREPVRISVKTGDTSKNVDQDVVRIQRGTSKVEALLELLTQTGFDKVLVFGQTKHGVERLSQSLIEKGFKAESIHGDKNHSKRQKALTLFKNNHVQVLVATDVAARGLDISDVSHVINYDLPNTYEDYIHRIGRTGRAGKKGKALTFIE